MKNNNQSTKQLILNVGKDTLMTSTIYGIVVLIAGIGIPRVIIKYVAKNKKDRRKTNSITSDCESVS